MDQQKQTTVLIVDDTVENIEVLSGLLRPHYKVKAARDGATALKIANMEPRPDLILLDVMMPGMDGHEVCEHLKQDPLTASIPVIFVTAKSETKDEQQGFSLGAVDYITKPISPPIVLARVRAHLSLHDQEQHLESLVRDRTAELQETRLQIIRRLGRAAEYKDNETGMHVIRMSWFSRFLGEELGMPADWCEVLYHASPMHDIGKIGIPDRVLLKPAKLDAEEWEIMKRHSEYGAAIIGEHDSDILRMASEIALYHHEKWDGNGYPNGLKGEDIPISARIVAVADVFDALTSERPYKKAWTEEDALSLIESEAGKHFDPNIAGRFRAVIPRVREIQAHYRDVSGDE